MRWLDCWLKKKKEKKRRLLESSWVRLRHKTASELCPAGDYHGKKGRQVNLSLLIQRTFLGRRIAFWFGWVAHWRIVKAVHSLKGRSAFATQVLIVCFAQKPEVWVSSTGTAPDAMFRLPQGYFLKRWRRSQWSMWDSSGTVRVGKNAS